MEIARGRGRWRRRRRERLYAPIHTQKHKGVARGGDSDARMEWEWASSAAPTDLIHLIPGRSNARRGLGSWNTEQRWVRGLLAI